MSTQIATQKADASKMLSEVITKGNLALLSDADKTLYYTRVCESVGLNPLTKPLEYITLNGKMVLYALRGATDQLRSIYKVSVEELTESEREGVFTVTAKVRNGEGRTDMAKGAVNIAGLKGDNLANALMKAETKAKRRATLSICGLGILDETEVETIPNAHPVNITPVDNDPTKPASPHKNASLRKQFQENVTGNFHKAKTHKELTDLIELDKPKLNQMEVSGSEADQLSLDEIRKQYKICWNRLAIATRETPEPEDATFEDEEIPAFVRQQMEEDADRKAALDGMKY